MGNLDKISTLRLHGLFQSCNEDVMAQKRQIWEDLSHLRDKTVILVNGVLDNRETQEKG